MEYVRLGRSGLEVSRICLGCMSFGDPGRGNHTWTLGEEDSRAIVRHAIELGINFFDTANVYSAGHSEEIVGRALRDFGRRDEIVLATKVRGRMAPGPNGEGLSRKSITAELENSLRRLGVDYVDLYQIHRWDPNVPIEETLEALHDAVKSGKARYIGASSMWAWQFAKSLYAADARGLVRFVSMQDHYNLLYREGEREMFPLCAAEGIGVIPWSPLARGKLARPWTDESSARSTTDPWVQKFYATDAVVASDRAIVERVHEVAAARGIPAAQVSMAWLLSRPAVTAPIVGPTKIAHVDDAVAALDVHLAAEEIAALEEPYTPHPVVAI
jgi:1-deoxyxylulose-5-phosphate synthase